jgi:hypothetical protein
MTLPFDLMVLLMQSTLLRVNQF